MRPALACPTILLAIASCSGSEAASNQDGPGFKSASADNVVAGSGVTNVVALSFVAPTNGYAWASATGGCAVVEPLPVDSVLAAEIELSPTDDTPNPGDSTFPIAGGRAAPSSGSFSVTRALAAPKGGNTIYLNVANPSSGGKLYCSATLTVLFSEHELP